LSSLIKAKKLNLGRRRTKNRRLSSKLRINLFKRAKRIQTTKIAINRKVSNPSSNSKGKVVGLIVSTKIKELAVWDKYLKRNSYLRKLSLNSSSKSLNQ